MKNEQVNFSRYKKGQKQGFYESFFQRANHPTEPRAFWIRYTIFSPNNAPEKAIGELWAIYFDGSTGNHITVKKEVPFEKCLFDNNRFFAKAGDAVLEAGKLFGNASSNNNKIEWNLDFSGKEKVLFSLPENLYEVKFPKAKFLVGIPFAQYNGSLIVNEKTIEIKNWIGSQNHNWGIKHTDHYAWGQVAGFDNYPESFLELATARLKFGPIWTPFMTLMVLRHNGKEFRLNTISQSLKANGRFENFHWKFSSDKKDVKIEGEILADKKNFVELKYYNPPGGIKICQNTKIAYCKVKLHYKNETGKTTTEILETANRAAFEILTDVK